MKRISLVLAAALALSLTACNNATNKSDVMTGTFEGTMPAADCEGILTTLTVNADSTYTLKQEYIGVKDGLFEASGVYNLLDNDVIELITPSSGEKTYFKKLDKSYMLSDSLGTVNKGELAEHYILKIKK